LSTAGRRASVACHDLAPDARRAHAEATPRTPPAVLVPVTLASGGLPLNPSLGVAVDATTVYWTNYGGYVEKLPLGGGTFSVLTLVKPATPYGIAVDATSVYFAEKDGTGTASSRLLAMPKGGGTPTTVASGTGQPYNVVVDTTSVYGRTFCSAM
jgi:hypothetical protein